MHPPFGSTNISKLHGGVNTGHYLRGQPPFGSTNISKLHFRTWEGERYHVAAIRFYQHQQVALRKPQTPNEQLLANYIARTTLFRDVKIILQEVKITPKSFSKKTREHRLSKRCPFAYSLMSIYRSLYEGGAETRSG